MELDKLLRLLSMFSFDDIVSKKVEHRIKDEATGNGEHSDRSVIILLDR